VASLKTTRRTPARSPFLIRSLSVTQGTAATLDRLAQEASANIGWTVSSSAIMRALLHHADQQKGEWIREQLFPLIAPEIQEGTVWGKKK
jgi:hypothetical protein